MNIWVKPYTKRDGSVMFYINNDRGVSLGISKEAGYQSSKASKGQQNLWHAFCEAARNADVIATGADMANHDEAGFVMFNGIGFAVTDVATVGGVSTGSDGLFIVVGGNVVKSRFSA